MTFLYVPASAFESAEYDVDPNDPTQISLYSFTQPYQVLTSAPSNSSFYYQCKIVPTSGKGD